MADAKISQLPVASTPLAGTELVPVVQGGVTDQTTVEAILTGTVPSGTANGVLYLNGSKVVTSGSALTFDGTSSVGLGIASPILSAAGRGNLTINGSSDSIVAFGNNGSNSGYIYSSSTKLEFDAAGTRWIQWNTNGSEAMRLTSTGLGIGTSSPSQKLDVVGSAQIGNSSTNPSVARFYNANSNLYIGVDSAAGGNTGVPYATYFLGFNAYPMTFYTNATERMRIDSSGNLGLGVTPSGWGSAYKALQVSTGSSYAASSNAAFWFSNAYNDNTDWRYITSTNASGYTQFGGVHSWFTAPSGTAGDPVSFTQSMTLDASGNLGIGATSPTSGFRLDVQATTARQRIESTTGTNQVEQRLINTGGTFYVSLDNSVGGGFGAAYSAVLWHTGNYPMLFATNNTERARVPAAGGMVVGIAAIATTATDGFLYVPTCAGTPTGTPTTQTGTAPIVIDTTNHKLYFYSGGTWRDAGP